MKLLVVSVAALLPGAPALIVHAAHGQTISVLHDFPPNLLWAAVATGVAVNPMGIYAAACTWRGEGFVRRLGNAGAEVWTRQFAACAGAIAADADGIYVINRVSPERAFLRKYSATGNELWLRAFAVTGTGAGIALAVDSNGVYVAGTGLLRKYTPAGQELWLRELAGAGQEIVHAMAADGTNVYVVGRTRDQAFLREYNAAGDEQWTRHAPLPDTNYGVSADATGIYVAGRSGSRAFVRKYDVAGNDLWNRVFGGPGQSSANTVSVDESGIYVSGSANSLSGQCRSGATDIFVRKYDIAGNELWTRQFGAAGSDLVHGVALDAGAVYVAGVVQQPRSVPKPLVAKIGKSQAPDSDTRPRINCIANAASRVDIRPDALFGTDDSGVAPGEIVTVYGRMIGPDESITPQVTEGGSVGTSLGGARVFFDGLAAPVLYVSAGQINAIAPLGIAARDSVEIEVEYRGERSNRVTARVVRAAPGIFTRDGSGVGEALAINEDGSLNSLTNPARPGSAITIYSTGEGLSDPSLADGQVVGDTLTRPRAPVSVWACCDYIFDDEEPYRLEVLDLAGVRGSVAGLLKTRVRLRGGRPSATPTQLPVAMQIGAALTDWQVYVTVQ